MMNLHLYFYGLVLLLVSNQVLFVGGTRQSWCMESERDALLKFKHGLVDEFGVLSSWLKATDCCKWRGIECSNRTRHVIALDLQHRYPFEPLRGTINISSLLDLKQLTYLDLSLNNFEHSRIPKFIGLLHKLQYLNLGFTNFFGSVPDEIGNLTELRSLLLIDLSVKTLDWLTNLRSLQKLYLIGIDLGKMDWLTVVNNLPFLSELSLSGCNLPGIISSTNTSQVPLRVLHLPSNNFKSSSDYNWLLNFSSSLVEIDLSYNPLGSSIPPFLAKMRSVEKVTLDNCALSGNVPNFVKNLTRLRSISLANNNFSQPLKDIFQMLIDSRNSLESLELSWNRISGPLPDLQMFPFLKELWVGDNKLTGRVPESIGQLSNLKVLALWTNTLSWQFDSDWTPLFQLEYICLANSNMGPHFPEWLRSQKTLIQLDISNANISDIVPSWFWDLSPQLLFLNLSHNQMHGMLPDSSIKFVDIKELDLHSNHFTGQIPVLPPTVQTLILSKNNFSGSIIPLCQIATEQLLYLDLSNNLLSGEVPNCWVHAKNLEILDLANNNFSGKIPTTFGIQPSLQVLNLRHNSFVGNFSLMRNCTHIRYIDVSENKLSGEVPDWLGTYFTLLVVLNFRMNQLHGSIPPDICHLINIQLLDLSHNNMSGNIPRCFDKLYSLVETNSSWTNQSMGYKSYRSGNLVIDVEYVAGVMVQWKGKILEYKNTLGLLKCIDLSSNKLLGDIPSELAKLEGLISLNLSRNNLSGDIMGSISEMKMLEVLDLSKNQLSGEIPSGLGMLNFLSVLDLSDNKISGKIPLSTQLQSFNVTSYDGNSELCGLPLPKKCPGEDKSAVPTSAKYGNEEEDEDTIVTTGFYISSVLGFVVAFWGFYGLLLIRNSWRYAYFNFVDKIIDLFYQVNCN